MAMLNNQMVLLTMSENPSNDHLLPLELGMCNMGYPPLIFDQVPHWNLQKWDLL